MTTKNPSSEREAIRARVIATAYRCLERLIRHMSRDWLYCGKAACWRSRRCRGSACDEHVRLEGRRAMRGRLGPRRTGRA